MSKQRKRVKDFTTKKKKKKRKRVIVTGMNPKEPSIIMLYKSNKTDL